MLLCALLVLVALENGEVRVYKDKVLCNIIETPVSLLSIELHLSFLESQIIGRVSYIVKGCLNWKLLAKHSRNEIVSFQHLLQ